MLRPRIFEDNFEGNLFDEMFRFPFYNGKVSKNLMNTDVRDMGDYYQLDIELPGYQKEEIQADLKNGYLTITANHVEEIDHQHKNGNYVRKERYSGQCQRSFYVGDGITEEDVKAKFDNGILELVFPKGKNGIEGGNQIYIE